MLANRVLPPILPPYSPPLNPLPPPLDVPAPPVATFFNIPRRYVKSNTQSKNNSVASSAMDPTKSSVPLRKSSRIHELQSASTPTTSPVERSISSGALPSPSALAFQANRKRYASFGDEANGVESADGNSSIDSRSPPLSASSTGSGEVSGHLCLCQPEPKIPRPRNAFILYRQHHQHDILARYPGLANPEISKIIGEQWKAESDDSKRVWQDLAQLEKERHQEQYPDYRYQPRRVGKPGSLHVNTQGHVTVDKYRCPRCGGRSIRTPTSPFVSASGTPPTLPPPNLSEGLTPTTRYLPMMSNLSLDSPARRRVPGPSNPSNIQINSSHSNGREDGSMLYTPSPLTPDSKRRRFSNYPGIPTSTVRRDAPSAYYTQQQHHRRDSLPPILMRPSPPNTAGLPPTGGPHGPGSNPPRTPRGDFRRSSVDLNLQVPTSPQQQHDQSRSVEAMVMSVPYHVKIKVLGRINPPLREAGPTSPAPAIRGAIVAVEGDDLDAVEELTTWLHKFLAASTKEFRVKVQEAPKTPDRAHEGSEVGFEAYLDLVKEWHGKSREMVKFITTIPPRPSSQSSSPEAKQEGQVPPLSTAAAAVVTSTPPSAPSQTHPTKPSTATTATTATTTTTNNNDTDPPPLPILLLPTYQLHAANTYASRIPITDVYSPMDHWQWMATLWRGTVGPDLTIYVKSSNSSSSSSSTHPAASHGHNGAAAERGSGAGGVDVEMRDAPTPVAPAPPGGGGGGGAERGGKLVEVNEEGRWVRVVCGGKGGGRGGGGRFKEAALRRVGFEVGEWVRGVGKTGGGAGSGSGGYRDG